MLINKTDHFGPPARILGTRWIVFGTAMYDLSALIAANSYLVLAKHIPGGLTSTTWQTIKSSPALEYPEPGHVYANEFASYSVYNFGRAQNRVVLIDQPSSAVFAPEKIGTTSFIALNPAAHRSFTAWFKTIPGGTAPALAAFTAVPGGLGGGTLGRLRAALHD